MGKRIVLVGPVYPYKGGISHYTGLLYRALCEKYEARMISYSMQYPKLLFKKEQKDFSNDAFRADGTEYLINTANPVNILRAAGRIAEYEPDAVLIQWWHPYFAPCYRLLTGRLKKAGIKILFTCHNVFPHERFVFDRFLTKLTLSRGDGFVLHSGEEAKELLHQKRHRIFKLKIGMGDPRKNVAHVLKIAEALGVSASFLMDEEGSADNGTAAGDGQIRSGVMGDIEAEFGKKGAREAREVLERAGALLAGGDLDDEAKDVFFQALMEVYLDSKRSAREKYSPAKYRASRRKKDGDSVQR